MSEIEQHYELVYQTLKKLVTDMEQSNSYRFPTAELLPPERSLSHEGSEELGEEELAAYFGVVAPIVKQEQTFDGMTADEIDSWQAQQDNSNDIYKISARVKNLARISGNLTDNGEMVCNTFVHMLKAFYDFAPIIRDNQTRAIFLKLVKAQEKLPADLIEALGVGIKSANRP